MRKSLSNDENTFDVFTKDFINGKGRRGAEKALRAKVENQLSTCQGCNYCVGNESRAQSS